MKPKIKILILLSFSLFTFHFSPVFSQLVQQEWVRTYVNPYGMGSSASDMCIDTSGNIYITGGINRPDSQNGNYITIKYNSSGVQQWAVEYNGPGSNSVDQGVAVTTDKFGNIFVTGHSEQYGLLTDAYCTIKYDSSGVQQWVARYKYIPYGQDDPTAITVDNSEYVYVTGISSNYNNFGGSDYCTVKYNSNGDSVWVRRFNAGYDMHSSNYNGAYSICLDKNDNVYVTGDAFYEGTGPSVAGTIKYNSSGVQEWVNYFIQGSSGSGGAKVKVDTLTNDIYVAGGTTWNGGGYLLIKYNSSGVQEWTSFYYSQGGSSDMAIDDSHNIYICGNNYVPSLGYDTYLIIKYDSSGKEVWPSAKRIDRMKYADNTEPHISLDKYNNVYLTGSRYNNSISNYEFITVKYNSNGDSLWAMTYPGGGHRIAVDNSLNVYVTGSSNGNPNTVAIITIKYSQLNDIKKISNEIPKKIELFQNYPNPFNSYTNINFNLSKQERVTLKIYNILGEEISTLINNKFEAGKYKVNFDASNLSSGIYFYSLKTDNYSETKKMILIK